jgi:hypothetical protein
MKASSNAGGLTRRLSGGLVLGVLSLAAMRGRLALRGHMWSGCGSEIST